MTDAADLTEKRRAVLPLLDERARRLLTATEAKSLGYGGVSRVQRACGLSRRAIAHGMREIDEATALPPGRIRRTGSGPEAAGRPGPAARRHVGSDH